MILKFHTNFYYNIFPLTEDGGLSTGALVGISTGALVGISVGVLAGVLLCTVAVCCCCCAGYYTLHVNLQNYSPIHFHMMANLRHFGQEKLLYIILIINVSKCIKTSCYKTCVCKEKMEYRRYWVHKEMEGL